MFALRLVALAVFVFATGVAQAQECALGTSPTCGGTCQPGLVCDVVGPLPNPCGCVPGDPLAVVKLALKVNFKKSLADSVGLQALIPVPAGFVVSGRMVVIDVGGVVRSFVLDEKGAAKSDGTQLKLAVKSQKGAVAAQIAKLAFKGAKGSWADDWADEGLTNVTVDAAPVQMRASVRIDTHVFATAVPLTYKAKQGKSGKASSPK